MVPQEGIQTPDPIITNEVLYQLSYCGALRPQDDVPRSARAVYANLLALGNMSLGTTGGHLGSDGEVRLKAEARAGRRRRGGCGHGGTVGGQARGAHGGGGGDRPRDGGSLRPGGRACGRDRHRPRRARRARRATGAGSTCARTTRSRRSRAALGPVDVLFNCAGFVHHGDGARMLGRGLGLLLRPQRQVDAPHDPRLPARHAGEGRRLDRQHRLGRLVGARRSQPLRLWRVARPR